ncbi:Clavaminate synthase-like protein [Meredithblackwellia eburnea MCA 4105]
MPSVVPPRPPIEAGPWPKAPFPSDIKTHPLLVVDYAKIAANDEDEINTLFTACSTLGFFYLKNYGFEEVIEPMFEMGEDTFQLPLEELLKFEMGDGGRSAGYKKAGGTNVDAKGNLDTVEFMNISKDDALAYPEPRQRTYPTPVNAHMKTIHRFVKSSDEVIKTIFKVLEPKIGLPGGTLDKLHANGAPHLSGSEARVIYKPAAGTPGVAPEGVGEDGKPSAAIGSHTDFGSFSMLHGRGTGGLQVLPPGSDEWQHIRPIPGHAILNVGDTLAVYTGGLLHSNVHRVVPPPGEQAKHTRWSLVFFLRPSWEEELYPLSHLSPQIAEAAQRHPTISKIERGSTAGEWFFRRVAGQRTANRKGPESWKASRGTEHDPDRD